MLRRITPRSEGFSLIELLVVISIIAVLMGLLLSAVQKVRDVGPRADTTARITAINNAIGTFKSNQSFGQVNFIPPGAINLTTGAWGAFQLRDSYGAPGTTQPDINSFEAQYIIQVFGVRPTLNQSGQPQIVSLGNPGLNKTLDANQTLTFFLTGIPTAPDAQGNVAFTGFSTNSQAPFTPRAAPDEARRANGPLLDLGGGSKKKYALGAGGMAVMIDGFGNPFAYFAAYDGKANKFYGGANGAYLNTDGKPMGTPTAYLRNSQFENPTGFQIISAGRDGFFGTTGNWNNVGPTGMDDQANFSDRLLGAGPK